MGNRWVTRFSVESLLYHNPENFRKGILLCCVSEKFPQRKRLWIRKGVSRSSGEKFFVSECRKFRGGKVLCCVSENFRWRKTLWIREGAIKIFRRFYFVPQRRKISQGNPIVWCFRKMPAAKKIMDYKVGYQDLPSKGFVSQSAESFVGENFCAVFQKVSGSENVYGLESGLSRFSVESFLYHNAKNFGKGTLLCRVSENFR